MSAYTDAIDDLVGLQSDGHDIRASVAKAYLYDFDGYPTRLWNGHGVLIAGGHEWIGTIGPDGRDFHQVPNVTDPRDGSNPEYRFGLPFIDKATYDALQADQTLVEDRTLTGYRVVISPGEGLRPAAAPAFAWAMTMKQPLFATRREGSMTIYSAQVAARSIEAGRARVPGGTYTDTAQRERARLLGVASDSFCVFVASNARRTITVEGG